MKDRNADIHLPEYMCYNSGGHNMNPHSQTNLRPHKDLYTCGQHALAFAEREKHSQQLHDLLF
jgi:hypothetical protein